ncbi:MAG: baseplate J/gp47 family protein [Clostridiales bacterium]|nr:baseplate J/gp47 family protein [Clostridiales bacterium]
MKADYFGTTNVNPSQEPEIQRALEITASELFALYCRGDYIFNQSYPQTATGEYLDKLGELRDCERKHATQSTGTLTFSVSEAAESDIDIDEGTVCSVTDKPFIQFATTEKVTLEAGKLTVTANAQSLGCGEEYNALANTINEMVNPPTGISKVTNGYTFTGGSDEETDTAYRNRILTQYTIPMNGINASSFESAVLKLDNISDCYVPNAVEAGKMTIYILTKNGILDSDLKEKIMSIASICTLVGAEVNITQAKRTSFNLTVDVTAETYYSDDYVESEVTSLVKNICSLCKIGVSLDLSEIEEEILKLDGITSVRCDSSSAVNKILNCDAGVKLKLSTLTVNVNE